MINDLYICRGFKPNRGEEKDRTERKKDGRRTEEKEKNLSKVGTLWV